MRDVSPHIDIVQRCAKSFENNASPQRVGAIGLGQ